MMVSKRSGLLNYLRNVDRNRYLVVINKLGLRK
jgi:ribosomal protein S15P/S13E